MRFFAGLICAEGDLWRVHRKFALKCINLFGGGKVGNQRRQNLESLILKEAHDVVDVNVFHNIFRCNPIFFLERQTGIGSKFGNKPLWALAARHWLDFERPGVWESLGKRRSDLEMVTTSSGRRNESYRGCWTTEFFAFSSVELILFN